MVFSIGIIGYFFGKTILLYHRGSLRDEQGLCSSLLFFPGEEKEFKENSDISRN